MRAAHTSSNGLNTRILTILLAIITVALGCVSTAQASQAVEGLKTEPATNVTAHSATLHGVFEPNGHDTHYYFECFADEARSRYSVPAAAPGLDAGSASELVSVEAELTGIGGNTPVQCWLIASNSFGVTESERLTFITEKAAPTVEGVSPSAGNLTATTAAIGGMVMTQNETTTYWVEYADAEKYEPEATNPYAAGESSAIGDLEAKPAAESRGLIGLTDLAPQTTYHYRLSAKNGSGETRGADHTFTTGSLTPPVAGTGDASGITATAATIAGSVDPEGLRTSYEFQIGTDTTYGGAEIFGNAGDGEGDEAVRVELGFLVPGTTYHYRIIATSKDGTSYGADRTFTTSNVPSPIAQPVSVPLLSVTPVAFPAIEKARIVKRKAKKKSKTRAKHRKAKHGKAKRPVKVTHRNKK